MESMPRAEDYATPQEHLIALESFRDVAFQMMEAVREKIIPDSTIQALAVAPDDPPIPKTKPRRSSKVDLSKPNTIHKAIKDLPIRRPIELTDSSIKGLSARIRKMPDGHIIGTWACRIMADGKTTRISLGDYAAMTGEQARAAALDARAKARQGEMVQSHSAAAKATRQAAHAKTVTEAQASTSLHDQLCLTSALMGPNRVVC